MSLINVSLGDLEAFLVVADTGSFRKSAERLNVSQPGISARIQHLEAVLGTRLFDRTTRRVNITKAGERLHQRVEHTMGELRELTKEFQDELRLRRGRVVLGATPSVGAGFLPGVIGNFQRRWPAIELVLHDDFFGRALDRLTRREVDLAVLPFEPEQPGFEFDLLITEAFAVALPTGHPSAAAQSLSLEDIAALPLISVPPESAYQESLRQAFANVGWKFRPAFQTRNGSTSIAMVRAGLGVTFVTPMVCSLLNMDGVRTVPIRGGRLIRRIGIVTVAGRVISPAARAMISQLHEFAALSVAIQGG